MSKALEDRIAQLFEQTKDLHNLEEIKPYCESFNEWVNTSTTYSSATLGTKLSAYGFYKKFKSIPLEQDKNAVLVPKHNPDGSVKSHELKHYATVLCGLNEKQWNERNQTTRVIDRLENSTEIDTDRYLETTGILLTSTNPHELAVGIIACTGRRPHEVLAHAKFTVIANKPYHVMFAGQGKKRGKTKPFEIATLYPADYVIKALARLRKDPSIQTLLNEVSTQYPGSETRQNVELDSRRGQSLRRVVRAYFGDTKDHNPVLAFRHGEEHDNCKALRSAYTTLAVERDCKGSFGAKILYASRILGHFTPEKPDDRALGKIATSVGYSDYYTTKPVKFLTMPEQKQKMKLTQVRTTQSDFDAIIKLQAEWKLPNQQSVIERLLEPQKQNEQLQRQLIEAQQKIADMQKVITDYETQRNQVQQGQQVMNQQSQPQPQVTEATEPANDSRIDKLEAQMGQMMVLMQRMVSGSTSVNSQEPAPESVTTTTPARKQITKDIVWESIPNEQLRDMKSAGAVEEKIYRAFRAITQHNDSAPSNDDRWYIGSTTLSQVSGCNRQAVGEWVKTHKTSVDDHNEKYKLEQYHNKRHKKIEITEKVKLWERKTKPVEPSESVEQPTE